MGAAKSIVLKPIKASEANALVRRVHYSGKVVNNSQFHIGVFYRGSLEGAMQFGPSLDKRKIQGLVSGTAWHEFIELNRMAFSDLLPRNSESRALGIAMRILRKHAPQIKWVVSFADATQCGDGTIYRAAGFVLTGIKENSEIYEFADGLRHAKSAFMDGSNGGGILKRRYGFEEGEGKERFVRRIGAEKVNGYQLRYIYFIDRTSRERLTVPELPYSEIERVGAGMYKGEPRAGSIASDAPANQAGEGGAVPTSALETAVA